MNEALKALTRGETDEERKKRIQKEEEAEQRAAEAARKSPYQKPLSAVFASEQKRLQGRRLAYAGKSRCI